MADWSVVAAAAVTGVTGVVSGGIGYLLGHEQTRAQERQAYEARRETLQTRRAEAYHNFLDIDRQLPSRLSAGLEVEQKDMQEWLSPFNHSYNAVILLGSDGVADHARELFEGYLRVYDSLTEGGKSWPDAAERQAAWQEHRGELDEARKRLIEAMRSDVFDRGGRRPPSPKAERGMEL